MAKKKKKFQETTIENYYDLKIDKVNELVAALKDEVPETEPELSMNISDCTGESDTKNVKRNGRQKKFDPYKMDLLSRIPSWLIAVFVKWWFAGAVCYFVMWGVQTIDDLDKFVITGVALGIIVDLMVNPIFKFLETDKREYDNFMMFPFPFKAFWTFFVNIVYYVIVLLGVVLLNMCVNKITGWLGVEPLLFATYALIVDMAFIGIKDGVVALVKKLRKKENEVNV